MAKYLDLDGLTRYDGKIKTHVSNSVGTKKYQHNLRLYYSSSNACLSLSVITSSSTALTYNTLPKALYDAGFNTSSKICPANGFYITGTNMYAIYGAYNTSSTSSGTSLQVRYAQLMSRSSSTATLAGSLSEGALSLTLTSSWTITDTVVALR